jgi:hypothetical protein
MRMRTLGVLSFPAGALTCAAQQGATPGTAVPLAVASDFPPGAVVVQGFGERFDYNKGERP